MEEINNDTNNEAKTYLRIPGSNMTDRFFSGVSRGLARLQSVAAAQLAQFRTKVMIGQKMKGEAGRFAFEFSNQKRATRN